MRVAIAADHGGFDQKGILASYIERELGCEVADLVPDTGDSVDYPDYAVKVAHAVASGEADFGVLICGTGIGMALTADKVPGVRASSITSVPVRRALPPAQQRQRRVPLGAFRERRGQRGHRQSVPHHRLRGRARTNAASRRSWPLTKNKEGTLTVAYDVARVTVVDHPLVQHKLSILRDERTGTKQFRDLVSELAMFEGYEATRDLPLEDVACDHAHLRDHVQAGRRQEARDHPHSARRPRHGRWLARRLFRRRAWGISACSRDEVTHEPHEYYCKLPQDIGERICLIVDPMLATGGSAADALKQLRHHGARRHPPALDRGCARGSCPRCSRRIQTFISMCAAIDEGLNERAYIVPGLGDAGDRIFGTL